VTDRRSLSRRKLLWAVATIGAAASTGSGAAAVLSDSETVDATLTTGVLDLDSTPSWGNDGSIDGNTGSISGQSGSETVTLSTSGNPSYVWFRTRCKQCTDAEETLQVRFGLDTDGDDDVERWLDGFDGGTYLSLREARDRLGGGTILGEEDPLELAPDDSIDVVVGWQTADDTLMSDLDVSFDFEFYATQTRHVMNTDKVAPDWDCPDVVCDPPGGEDPPSGVKEISYVALCSSDIIAPSDVTLEFSDDGTTVTVTDVTDDLSIDEVLLKYSTKLDVFGYGGDPSSYVAGSGTTYEKPDQGGGGGYEGTDRTNSDPCLTEFGIKYDVGSGWGGDE
jgi:hypothetical protein